jgi:serine/threonine-protein kinase
MTVRKDRAINVIVSNGSELKQVPDLIGKSLQESEIELRRVNLTLGEISRAYSLRFKKDEIMSHDPQTGKIVEKDELINVVVSDGMPPVGIMLMPDFVNSSIEDAKKWAIDNDFENIEISEDVSSFVAQGTIIDQKPRFDEKLSIRAKISFVVSAGTPAAGAAQGAVFEYAIPQGSGEREVKIIIKDRVSERMLFKGKQKPGTKLHIPYSAKGSAQIRVFVNDILVDERFISGTE